MPPEAEVFCVGFELGAEPAADDADAPTLTCVAAFVVIEALLLAAAAAATDGVDPARLVASSAIFDGVVDAGLLGSWGLAAVSPAA